MPVDPPPADYKDDLRAAYDADVDRRDAMDLAPWRSATVDTMLDRARAEGIDSVLDLGCGTGQLAKHVMDRGFDVGAVDLSPGNVAAARRRGVDAVVGDFADLPFADASFGAAYGFHTLIHVPEDELTHVMGEIRRVLQDGAFLLVVTWGGERHAGTIEGEWLDPPRYFSFYPDDVVRERTFAGFTFVDFAVTDVPESGLRSQALTLRAV